MQAARRGAPSRSFVALELALAATLPQPLAAADAGSPAAPDPARASAAAVAALAFDVRRIVAAEAADGWLLEELALSEIHPDVMESVCRAAPEVRAGALEQLERESADAGDARALYESNGARLTSSVQAALDAQRRLSALQRGVAAAERDCPFWLPSQREFRGVQSMRDRWIVNFDTGGTAQLRRALGSWSVGAGGFGRVLGGYGFTRFSLLAGVEFGGGALLEPDTRPTAFVVNYIPALPLIVRWHQQAWNIDLEAASVGLFQASDTRLSYGLRAGVTLGVAALRLRGILPWVGLGIASEYHFENAARPEAWYVRGGLRVGGVWDP